MTSPNGRGGSVASAQRARAIMVLKGVLVAPSSETPGQKMRLASLPRQSARAVSIQL